MLVKFRRKFWRMLKKYDEYLFNFQSIFRKHLENFEKFLENLMTSYNVLPALSKIYLLWRISISGNHIKCKSISMHLTGGAHQCPHLGIWGHVPPRAPMHGTPLSILYLILVRVYCIIFLNFQIMQSLLRNAWRRKGTTSWDLDISTVYIFSKTWLIFKE